MFLDHVQGSIHAGEDFKVFQFGGAVLQVGREVRKPFLGRNLGDFYRKASYGILLFQQRNIASDLRRGAGGFQSGGSCAYDDYAARLFDGCLLIGFSIDEIRIDGASKAVSYTHLDVYKRQQPWSAEIPRLYTLLVCLRSRKGELIEVVPQKIGFRRFELIDNVMCLNGKRILFKGINRHEFDARRGRAITREDMLWDIRFLKQHNINAVRTSHYPCLLYTSRCV